MPLPEKVPLILLPTPLHRLNRLSDELGIDLWIKRDDLTGFALGGNKGRKLEFLMAEILSRESQVVVACGSVQSNFIRQLGAACSIFGIQCVAAVMDTPYYAAAGRPKAANVGAKNANARIDEMLGVTLRHTADGDWEQLYAFQESVAQDYEAQGRSVYTMPIGGSSVLGAYSFVLASREAEAQEQGFDFILTPSSSGSTHSGLQWHHHRSATKVVGISADPDPDAVLVHDMVELCQGLDSLMNDPKHIEPEEFDLRMDWVGEGYGVPSYEGDEAIRLLAQREGIFLDPVYSGKAFAGLLGLVRSGEATGKVLFWHTGGTPVLFAD